MGHNKLKEDFVKILVQNKDADNFLMHHGILGQKWGIRRFQNKDGSLTDAGKKRYVRGSIPRLAPNVDSKNAKKYWDKQSNDGKMDYPLELDLGSHSNDSKVVARAEKLKDNFMSGKYNRNIYHEILNEYFPSYDRNWNGWDSVDKSSVQKFLNAIRDDGFNSGRISITDKNRNNTGENLYTMEIYANDGNTYGGHVFSVEMNFVESDLTKPRTIRSSLEG